VKQAGRPNQWKTRFRVLSRRFIRFKSHKYSCKLSRGTSRVRTLNRSSPIRFRPQSTKTLRSMRSNSSCFGPGKPPWPNSHKTQVVECFPFDWRPNPNPTTVPLATVMKRTRYRQKMSTSACRQFKQLEPNCSIRLPLSSPSSENVNRNPSSSYPKNHTIVRVLPWQLIPVQSLSASPASILQPHHPSKLSTVQFDHSDGVNCSCHHASTTTNRIELSTDNRRRHLCYAVEWLLW